MEPNETVEPNTSSSFSGLTPTKLKAAQIRLLYAQSGIGSFGALLSAVILGGALWTVVSHDRIVVWVLACVGLFLGRCYLIHSFHSRKQDDDAVITWGEWQTLVVNAGGLLWGVAGVWLFPLDSILHQFLLSIFVAGITAAGAVIYSPTKDYAANILLALLPLSGRFIYEFDEFHVTIGCVILLFAGALLLTGQKMHGVYADSLRLRYNKEELVEDLKQEIWRRDRLEAELKEAHEDLEIRVEVRTAELKRLNRSLEQEVAERKRTEQALKQSEEHYRIFFETSRDCVFMTSLDEQLIDFNDVALEMFGYAPGGRDELLQTNVANVYANTEQREAHVALVSKQGFSKEYPVDLRKKDGTIIHTLITAIARRDPQGTIIGFQGTVRDITERKRAEEVLQTTLQRFYTILSSLYAAVLLVSDEGRVEFANQAFCDVFDLDGPPSDLHGLGAVEMIKKIQDVYAQPAEAVARIQAVIAQQRPLRGEEIAMHGGKTYLADFIPILIDGKRYGRLWHHQDITDRKRMEEHALQSARLRAVADLSSGVAHHFNNLLQIIMGNTSLSLTDLESGDLSEVKTSLEKMLQAATLGAETVRRLQTFADTRTAVTEHECAVFDIATIVRNAAEVSKPRWKADPEKRGIKIDLQLNIQEGCLVKGQESEMFEVIVNLVKNAAEALPEGGDIEVKTYREADEVVVTVHDTGTGIAEEDLPKVFQPFWSSKGVGIGKGMGLAVAHGLARRHGGSISVQSKAKAGTTFTVRLPSAHEPVRITEEPAKTAATDNPTILVIDDDEDIAILIERICAKAGHTVFRALSGEEGLAIFNKEPVDMVISDLGMPGMNGWGVGKAIRSICQGRGIAKPAFILLTGYSGQELEKEKIAESGVDAIVPKPIDSATVLAIVQEIASRFSVKSHEK